MKNRIPSFDEFINESVRFEMMYHGGDLDFSKPIYFSNSTITAASYGKLSNAYTITFKKPVTIDFSTADGWWLPEEAAKDEVKKLGMKLEDFDKYRGHSNFRSVKTDHFVQAAKEKGFDGVIFKNIMDSGSIPIKGNKWIRATNVVALYPKESVKEI